MTGRVIHNQTNLQLQPTSFNCVTTPLLKHLVTSLYHTSLIHVSSALSEEINVRNLYFCIVIIFHLTHKYQDELTQRI